MITPFRGKFHVEWYPKTASTAYAYGDMVTIVSTAAGVGTLAKVTNSSTNVFGLIQRTVTAASTDYALANDVPVLVGDENAEWLCDVSTGTPATSDIGEWIDADDENSVDVNAYTVGLFLVTKIVSTTQVVVKMAKKSGVAVGVTA